VDLSSRAWVLGGVTALVFVSPLRILWAMEGAPWWGPFAAWGVIVLASAILLGRRHGAADAD
jgi:hypothetical protein